MLLDLGEGGNFCIIMTTTETEKPFKNRVALVTGSARGIGRAIAEDLAAWGADQVILDVNQADCDRTAAEIAEKYNVRAIGMQCDVSKKDQAEAVADKVKAEFKQLHILVNNAGVIRDNLMLRMKEEDWDLVLQTNLSSAYHCSKAAIRPMMRKRKGRIINITSVVGLSGQEGQTNYAASKAGLIGFTKSLAKEIGSRQITVNAVAPGFVPTALTDVLPQEHIEAIVSLTPLGGLGSVEDIAAAVAFLASD